VVFLLAIIGVMKKKVSKTSDENELVTKGFLREFVAEEFFKFRRETDRSFFMQDERFNKIDNTLLFIIRELNAMRQENGELRQMREQLYKSSIDQEFQIDDHEERIHKLEIAR
jgi:hypothetical protein